jgi:aminopeptidase N
MAPIALLLACLLQATTAPDPRADYDVQTYRLDLRVEPQTKALSGTVGIAVAVLRDGVDTIVLDLSHDLDVERVVSVAEPLAAASKLDGRVLRFTHEGELLRCELDQEAKKGEEVRIAVTYSGHPRAQDNFRGFHWSKTKDGQPWISTSCQDSGSAAWWPSKDSFFHPEDKPARVFENYTVPKGLYAVGNGRLTGRSQDVEGTETFHWTHGYPLETYSITLDAAPYVVVEKDLQLEGIENPVPFVYYVLPENAEKAALQFQDVPGMLAAYSHAFGPFPFPDSKYALVETSFWGMEHSTAVAYGSTYPAWLAAHGGRDRYASRNKRFDYILVHESAHEWWGNGVSARAWGDFWIHEGFATYAEAVYLESVRGADVAQQHMDSWKQDVRPDSRLYRGDDVDSEKAYGIVLYAKGAWVLHTLRQYVADDAAFWRSLRAFNLEYRYKNAGSQDFRAVLERETGADWKRFFDEWVYGEGFPRLTGSVKSQAGSIAIDVDDRGSASTGFHVPLDLAWTSGGEDHKQRVWLEPGENHTTIAAQGPVTNLRAVGLERILCSADVHVQ